MLRRGDFMDIRALHREGHSIRRICALSGFSRNTVRKALREREPPRFRKPVRASRLDPFKAYLVKRTGECALSAVRLLEELRGMGYRGSIWPLRRYLATLERPERLASKLTVRFETPPGKQAQADWASCGRFQDAVGRLVAISAFVMVLGFSRMLFVRFTTSMKLPELLRCHLAAFDYFGGLPREVLYDNMKQVKLEPGVLNPVFTDFLAHHDLVAKTHRPRRPRTKGKVERMVSYVRQSFLAGRSFDDLDDLNSQAQIWLDTVANTRTHATTGRVPRELLAEEGLTPLAGLAPYRVVEPAVRRVSSEGFVRFDRSRYSVPPESVGKTVVVLRDEQRVVIRLGDAILAEHPVATQPGSDVSEAAHIAALWKLSTARPGRPPIPSWRLRFDQQVESRSLSEYEPEVRA